MASDAPKTLRDRLTVPINAYTLAGGLIGVLLGACTSALIGILMGMDRLDYSGTGRGNRLIGLFEEPRKLYAVVLGLIIAIAFVYGAKWWSNRRHA